MSELAPGWTFPLLRKDGMVIQYVPETESYRVVDSNGTARLISCPCCDNLLKSIRACQLVCNGVYPLKEASP